MATAATLHSTPAHQLQTKEPSPEALQIPHGSVSTTLTYYAPPEDGSAPYNYVEQPPEGVPQRNYGSAEHKMTINDARGRESNFNTDTHGFALLSTSPSAEGDFTDDKSIEEKYYPEVDALLRSALGAHRTFIFDHTIRRPGPDARRGPVNRVHIDQTAKAAAERVRRHVPEEAEALLQGRYRIVNVWRPLNGPIVNTPLAMAASDSVKDSDVIPVQHRYPDRTGETAGIQHGEGQEFWYWSGMDNEERILLQCFDSQSRKRVAHTAFDVGARGEGWPQRESIEVRALVFG